MLRHHGVPAVLVVAALAATAAAQDAPTVVAIEFRGNLRTSEDTLRLSLRTKVGQKLDPALLPEDVSTLLQFFESVDLKEERTTEGVRLVFTVVERPPVVDVQVRGADGIAESEVRAALETTAGRPLADFRVANDQRKVERLYRSRGWHFAQVTPRIEDQDGGKRVVFEVLEGPHVAIESIEFSGNTAFPKDKLLDPVVMRERAFLGLRAGDYVEETVRQDLLTIRNFYRSQGWLDAQVDLEDRQFSEDRRRVRLQIRVTEGPVYKVGSVRVEGVRSFPGGAAALEALLTIRPGDRRNDREIDRSDEAIERAYREEGFFAAVVTPEEKLRPDQPVSDLVFTVDEASKVRVRSVNVAGNVVTQDKVIRREIPLAPGDVLNQNQIDKAVRKIRSLGYFERVTARVDSAGEGEDPNLRDVMFEVDDTAATGSISFGVTANSDTGLGATIRLTKRNFDWRDWPESFGDVIRGRAFTGAGQTFQLELSPGSDESRYRIAFTEPWLFDKPISFGWDLFLTQFSRFDYDQDARGLDFFLGRRWTFEGRERDTVLGVQGRTRIESMEIDNLDDRNTAPTAFLAEGKNSLISEDLTFRASRLDSEATPTQGWYGEVSTEVGFAGDIRLWKNSVEAKHYWLVHTNEDQRHHVLSLGAKLQWAEPMGSSVEADPNVLDEEFVPIYESYFAGGSTTVRGFAYGGAGPHGEGDPFLRPRPGENTRRRLRRVVRSILENDGDPMGGKVRFVSSAEYTFPLYEDILRGVVFCDAGMVRQDWDTSHGLEEDDVVALGLPYDEGESFFSDVRISLGFGLRIRIPQLGPTPLALDIGIPVRKEDGDDTQVLSFSIRRDF